MSDLDLDALEAIARAQAAAYSKMLELDGGVGLLGVRHPDMFEDMMAWDGSSENEHADTTLALIARIREAEAAIGAVDALLPKWAETRAYNAEAFTTGGIGMMREIDYAGDLRRILTRHQDKRENGSVER